MSEHKLIMSKLDIVRRKATTFALLSLGVSFTTLGGFILHENSLIGCAVSIVGIVLINAFADRRYDDAYMQAIVKIVSGRNISREGFSLTTVSTDKEQPNDQR